MYSGCMDVSKLPVSYLKAVQNNLADSALYKFQAIYRPCKYIYTDQGLCEIFIKKGFVKYLSLL